MSIKHWGALAVFCGLLLAAVPALAHHSVAAEYDLTKPVDFKGTLVQMEFINPHAMLHLEVTNKDGSKTVWIFQTTAAGTLRQKGLARKEQGGLYVGMPLEITGYGAKNGLPRGYISTLKLPDGRLVTVWHGDPNGN
jgi:hypothetical protein